jgi:hypothetical protein
MNTFSPLPELVFDDSISLDTTNHVFNVHTYATNATILFFFFRRQFAATWLFLRLENINAFRSESLKSRVLPQRTSRRELIGFTVNDVLIMTFSFPCYTQTSNVTEDIGHQHILDGMLFLLSTIIQLLFIWVRWPIYWSFCPIMEKKRVSFVDAASTSRTPSISSEVVLSL